MTSVAPVHITFTGVDDCTDLKRMELLSAHYPIEWGVLIGSRSGEGRFPSVRTIRDLQGLDINVAAHLCGREADEFTRYVGNIYDFAKRIQVNRRDRDYDKIQLAVVQRRINKPVIVQWRKSFDEVPRNSAFLHLFDRSGGRGQLPDEFPSQPDHLPLVGYAGGISPDNVLEVISNLRAQHYWIDMETGVRTDGWFDLDKCKRVCELVFNY